MVFWSSRSRFKLHLDVYLILRFLSDWNKQGNQEKLMEQNDFLEWDHPVSFLLAGFDLLSSFDNRKSVRIQHIKTSSMVKAK